MIQQNHKLIAAFFIAALLSIVAATTGYWLLIFFAFAGPAVALWFHKKGVNAAPIITALSLGGIVPIIASIGFIITVTILVTLIIVH